MTDSQELNSPGSSASLVIPANIFFTQALLDFAQTLSKNLGFNETEQGQIRLAIEEIFLFISKTALAENPDASVKVFFETRADGLLVRITEKGLPIDIDRLPDFSVEDAVSEKNEHGLSLHLVRNSMDNVTFINRGRDGLDIEMLKRKSAMHISLRMDKKETATQTAEPLQYTIRPAKPDEAIEIARCAYLTYGYSYEDYIYYPERINELNRTGELRSLTAVTNDGKVIGHCALKFTPGRKERAELGVLFVHPEYRKHGLGAALWKAAVELGRKLGLESIYARSVTGHRASQTIAEQHNFRDCALLLALFPREVELKKMGGLQPGKMSGMLQNLNLKPQRQRLVFPPKRYAEIVEKLYNISGTPVSVNPARQPGKDTPPIFRMRAIDILNIAAIEIESPGPDPKTASEWCVAMTRKLCREKIDAVYAYINMENHDAGFLAQECAKNGFIFSGIAPDAFTKGDALVLQYINQTENPFEQMTVWTDTAGFLRDYIQAEWKTLP